MEALTPLAAYALSLVLAAFPPGTKHQALEALPACGSAPGEAACPLERVCPEPSFLCSPPRWEPRWEPFGGTGAWVRVESREAGARRLEVVAQAMADSAAGGAPWPKGPTDLVRVMVSAFGWSTGFREDIQVGRTLGPGGETCLADAQLETFKRWAAYDLQRLPAAELRARVAGRDYDSLRRCFDAGVVGILRSMRQAELQCSKTKLPGPDGIEDAALQPLEQSMFALYHTGSSCLVPPPLEWAPGVRYRSLAKFRARKATVFPDWYSPPKIAARD